jgi:hypothetical protein
MVGLFLPPMPKRRSQETKMFSMFFQISWGIILSPVVLVCMVVVGLLIAFVYLRVRGAWVWR